VASDWVGVIGTGIGAGIGGLVTVASLIVKGRQEAAADRRRGERDDRKRREDQDWSIRTDGRSERRDLYALVLEAASSAASQRRSILLIEDIAASRGEASSTDQVVDQVLEGFQRVSTYNERVAGLEVVAVEARLLEHARQVGEHNSRFFHAVLEEVSLEELHQQDGKLSVELEPSLRDSCRRDLNLDVPS
jgi:hypothetical protein